MTHSLIVRFDKSDRSQEEMKLALSIAAVELKKEGILEEGVAEAIFPDEDLEFRGILEVKIRGNPERCLAAFLAVPGVRSAYIAPVRQL